MRRMVFAAAAAVALSAVAGSMASGQDWDKKTIEKMLADGTKKLS